MVLAINMKQVRGNDQTFKRGGLGGASVANSAANRLVCGYNMIYHIVH